MTNNCYRIFATSTLYSMAICTINFLQLGLQGFSIEEGQVGHDIEFLTEIMELNEALENGPMESLNNLRLEIKGKAHRDMCIFVAFIGKFIPGVLLG